MEVVCICGGSLFVEVDSGMYMWRGSVYGGGVDVVICGGGLYMYFEL